MALVSAPSGGLRSPNDDNGGRLAAVDRIHKTPCLLLAAVALVHLSKTLQRLLPVKEFDLDSAALYTLDLADIVKIGSRQHRRSDLVCKSKSYSVVGAAVCKTGKAGAGIVGCL